MAPKGQAANMIADHWVPAPAAKIYSFRRRKVKARSNRQQNPRQLRALKEAANPPDQFSPQRR